jgi:tRNA-2-methylthio-N6-dimethylallyladenosine synthase
MEMTRTQHLAFVQTFGCQMNVHDSETIRGVLAEMGYGMAASEEEADLILLNTCSVREKPHRKVFGKLGELRKLKDARPGLLIGVCGCMAQLVPEQLKQAAPHVDLIVGTRNYAELAETIRRAHANHHCEEVLDLERAIPEGTPALRQSRVVAWVTVIYGCNNFCAYCVVPYARGRERSRRPADVLDEILGLAAGGCREVTLLGQNVNTYGADLDDGVDFAGLLARMDTVPGIERIRFTTSHPKDCSERLIEAVASLPKVCEHLQLPVQSGDDDVLRRMNRTYTAAQYVELVERARAAIPGLALTTDVMVGFPGETEAQFAHTMELFRRIEFDQAFMFKYNNRPMVASAAMPDQVPEVVKQQRLEQLVALQNAISRRRNRAFEGHSVEVLVEGPRAGRPGQLQGRTRGNRLVVFEGSTDLVGQLVPVRVLEGRVWGLMGDVANR